MPAAAARDLIRAYALAPGFPEVNAAMRANTFSGLTRIRVPVTLAWPEHDRMVARLRHPPPSVRTVTLHDAGHLPMWDDPQQVADLLGYPAYLVVDIREPRELEREGMIPGAYRAPRWMLEFWVDPQSPYYKPALDDGRTLVLYCGSAWRSA